MQAGAMQPAAKVLRVLQFGQVVEELQQHLLGRVLRVLDVAQDLVTDGVDAAPMGLEQGHESVPAPLRLPGRPVPRVFHRLEKEARRTGSINRKIARACPPGDGTPGVF